ncbi:MAG TPA: tetratricopeptide repeat protein [Kofleriaceae bacterium]|nr:tetratricopeptide repeat protein [Kofleriaceae bacterium]
MTHERDDTPTHPAPIDVLSAQLDAFRKHPDDADGFAELRIALRTGGHGELLAEICELRAPRERDAHRAADVWSEAGEARLVLGQREAAERDLRAALELDPSDERAAARLVELYVVAGRHAAAADVLEAELEALSARGNGEQKHRRAKPDASIARRGQRHRLAAQIWDERLGRVDRALSHWQRAWQLEPDRTDALEAARAIYAALGDDAMVQKLYQAELDTVGDRAPAPRRAKIHHALGRLAMKAGDASAAAGHLEKALRLDGESLEVREALAEVYASPSFSEQSPEGVRKAGELFVDLGKRRLRTQTSQGDPSAITYLRRALGVDPYSKGNADALGHALADAGRWDELERLLRHRGGVTEDPREKHALLTRRAELYEGVLDDRVSLIAALTELAALEPPYGPASERLRNVLREDQKWNELAARIELEVDALADDPLRQVGELLEWATIAREHLGEKDKAAELLHRALSVDPHNEEALARYADHFRERRDWRGLADLYEFAFDNAREDGAPAQDLVRRLEDIAQIAEIRLGDVTRAIETWQRIDEIEPGSPKAREALRRLSSRAKMWEQLVGVLENEASVAVTPAERAEALRRIAHTYRERQVEPRRAIALYEEVLQLYPDDEQVLKNLGELYEREGDDGGLASTLRRQLELEARKLTGGESGRAGTQPKEWPVAKRMERLTVLRRLAAMCETRTQDVDGVVYACTGILEILPGDRDALDRMERVLDKAGDSLRLEQTLEYHAASATGPAERAKVLRRLAKLAADQGDDTRALERWEQTLRAVPTDHEALEAAASLFERAGRWGELAQVLARLDAGRGQVAPGTPEAAIRARELERYARVVDEKLGDGQRASRAWQRVLELSPKDRNALAALGRLHRAAHRWRELADVLAAEIPLYAPDEPERAGAAALERAQLLDERLGAPAEAAKQLERLIAELDPQHLDAHTQLRRLHEARGDFEAAVRVAEREMYLSPEPMRKVARGLEIGFLCRDRLGDPTRALQAFDRVLALDPHHDEALAAVADLQAKLGDWKAAVRTLEKRIGQLDSATERKQTIGRIAQITAERLGDPRGAFRWWRRAHDEAPDAGTLADLRRAAEAFALWKELADVYGDERRRLLASGAGGVPADPIAYVAASRELAIVAERRLADKQRALAAIHDALQVAPKDASLMAEAERIAAEGDQRPLWQLLLDSYEAVLGAASPAGKVEIYEKRARVLDQRLDLPKAAVAELLNAFAWMPEREETRAELHKLADRSRAFGDLVSVESALCERAGTDAGRVAALRRKAALYEEKLKDLPRAFRTHLVGFLIAPEDADTIAHLWRLGRAIGKYRDADKTPKPEGPPAPVKTERELADAEAHAERSSAGRVAPRTAHLPRRPSTQDIDLADHDLRERHDRPMTLTGERNLHVGDSTQPIDLDELLPAGDSGASLPAQRSTGANGSRAMTDGEELAEPPAPVSIESSKPARNDRTMELSIQDLVAVAVPPAAPSRGLPGMGSGPLKRPPPPPRSGPPSPAPLPGVHAGKSGPTSAPRKAQAAARKPPLPSLPIRSYESPWDEFATAYDALPAADTEAKLRWLFRAAEVWESGAAEIGRAFVTLARALGLAQGAPKGDGEVRARLHRLAADHDAWDRLASLYEQMGEAADTAAAAADLLMEVAAIRARQGRGRDAEAQYRRVLGMRPDDEIARARLENLYRNEGRWVELAASLEERTDPRLGSAAPEAERPGLLRELAELYTDKLHRPHDAIDSLERLRQMVPADVAVLRRLGEIYAQVGRWSKVIESLQRVVEIADGTADAREAMRSIAQIYERELEIPERAIETYAHVVASWPDDAETWAALDALYQGLARWKELADVLRRRAALEREPEARAKLLARRAGVLLDWLGAPEEAAAALRHARTISPEDPILADQLVAALVKADRAREAVAVLQGRLEATSDNNKGDMPAAVGDRAALLIKLAQIRFEALQDPNGARVALDEALRIVPDHPTALAQLANLTSPDEDPRAFAEAKLREAELVTDDDARIEALMAAGAALRDRVKDMAGARAAFERVLWLRPYHADATWALAGLIEQGGDPEAAAKLLETRLEDETLPPEEKARVLTQLAALARAAGVEMVAERRLEEALAAHGAHLPAIVALADLYGDAERWSDLEAFLKDILGDDTLKDAPASAAAELQRRLATAYEKLGRDEDAYQVLVAADRVHRGHLLIKLALGENRYKVRRWREAALHLSALATHEESGRHPAEVAQALYHAALAEIRSLRPEKAVPLYERALELKPNYAPALHALAEVAMEQGDAKKAADLITREATASEDPAERMRLFEALGDMAVMMLHDEERARTYYEAAVNAAQPIEARHLPLLEKLLERCDLAGDHLGAARTAELMAAFGADAGARVARYVAAAQSYLAGGDEDRAAGAAARALEIDPHHLDAAAILSARQQATGQIDAAIDALGKALAVKDEGDASLKERRAPLWQRLGALRRGRGDDKGASTALERAIALAPASDAATAARKELAQMLRPRVADDPALREILLEHLRAIAEATCEVADVVAWADELRRAAASGDGAATAEAPPSASEVEGRRGGAPVPARLIVELARAALDLAAALGHKLDVHQTAFLQIHKAPPPLADDEAYKSTVTPEERAQLIDEPHGDAPTPLHTIFMTLAEAAGLLWPDANEALARAGAGGAKRVSAAIHAPALAALPRITQALGVGPVLAYANDDDAAADVRIVCAATPIVVFGPRLLGEVPRGELRCLIGRAAEQTRPERMIAAGLPPEELDRLVAAVVRVFGPASLAPAVAALVHDEDIQRAHDEMVRGALPVKLRQRLEQLLAPLSPADLDVARYRAAVQRAADRAGVLVSADPAAAIAVAVGRTGDARHVVRAVLAPGHLQTRFRLFRG